MDMAEFRRRNDAQFDRANRALQFLGRQFITYVSEDLVIATPGFENQAPGAQTIPTGRLRGGYNYTRERIGMTSKGWNVGPTEDGPFSDYGVETVQRIVSQISRDRMGGISYLENNVAYGDQIVRGEKVHAKFGPRNWPDEVAGRQAQHARRAIQDLRGFR